MELSVGTPFSEFCRSSRPSMVRLVAAWAVGRGIYLIVEPSLVCFCERERVGGNSVFIS